MSHKMQGVCLQSLSHSAEKRVLGLSGPGIESGSIYYRTSSARLRAWLWGCKVNESLYSQEPVVLVAGQMCTGSQLLF